ncbi:Predicted hydrolase (HAD superfamily) [Phaffia rhodozyma]|uniref:Predicted hydrolase (HAD superfamily) n=1 Tax=Phaffia rhodozyma TaxID=264483 RepID=A0A0F7SVT8_PHARH|nr:Predicted hydrolase (HAD superfamily) [Phaffia rhodozyma]
MSSNNRIRLVLFDAFDTLLTPRLPIHIQYAQEARRADLDLTEDAIRKGFQTAFPALNRRLPLYGVRANPPITSADWWTFLIRSTLVDAGVPPDHVSKALPTLAPRLIDRFSSSEGYRSFDDTIPCLTALSQMGVRTGVLSNADDRILMVLDSLSISPLLSSPPTLNYTSGYSKPDARIFHFAIDQARAGRPLVSSGYEGTGAGANPHSGWAGVAETDGEDTLKDLKPEEVLMVGDELEADYKGSLEAGLRSLLIRRPTEPSDGAHRSLPAHESAELERLGLGSDSGVIDSLDGAIDFVRRWNDPQANA